MSHIERKPPTDQGEVCPIAPRRDVGLPIRNHSFLPDKPRTDKDALLQAHGYTWHLQQYKVYRGRTYRHWVLLAPDRTEISLSDALAFIERQNKSRSHRRKTGAA